ncbi:MAG: hypothetical protein KGH55_02975 [Nanoarchaeota archaeon]|nr:hypothetical protein [Nanoarchaeota archaeon]
MISSLWEVTDITETDKEIIGTYLQHERHPVNLDGFKRVNRGYFLEIEAGDSSQGYMLFPELQLDRDHEGRMERELKFQREVVGRTINRKFSDYREGISGFHWSVK